MYILTYRNLLLIYTNLISVRYGNIPVELYFIVFHFYTVIVMHITSIYIINLTIQCLIIVFCNSVSTKRTEKMTIKFIFIKYVIDFLISGSLHLFLWVQVTIWCYFLTPVQLFTPTSFVLLFANIIHFYKLQTQWYSYVYISSNNCFLKRKEKKDTVFYNYIITFTTAFSFFLKT